MKDTFRLGVLSALLFATSLPAFSAPSNADMGFAGGREPTAADVGYRAIQTRGYRDDPSAPSEFAGAAAGQSGLMHRSQANSDKLWFDGDNRETSQYLRSTANLPYRASSQQQSQTKQRSFQQMTQGEKMVNPYAGTGQGSVSQALLSRMSTSDINFKGPQNLGFRDGPLGFGTVRALNLFQFAPKTGTGSVNASICAPDGKQ